MYLHIYIYIYIYIYNVTGLTEGRRYYATLLSLLVNHNISMDTLTTPVFLCCMVTNSWKASVSIVAGSVKEGKTIHEVSLRRPALGVSQSSSVNPRSQRQSVFGVSQCSAVRPRSEKSVQYSSVSGMREATSAKVFIVIVTCVADVNLHSE
jgi:hypothetical protein